MINTHKPAINLRAMGTNIVQAGCRQKHGTPIQTRTSREPLLRSQIAGKMREPTANSCHAYQYRRSRNSRQTYCDVRRGVKMGDVSVFLHYSYLARKTECAISWGERSYGILLRFFFFYCSAHVSSQVPFPGVRFLGANDCSRSRSASRTIPASCSHPVSS